MDTLRKLEILTAAAKYDVSCSSSGSSRASTKGFGNAYRAGICHSWSDDGRCISLLKILLTNYCIYDCLYCVNRKSNDIKRATFTPDEVVALTESFYRRNYIEGLFLSSAIMKSPDFTMEMLLRAVKKLRTERGFNGYIHLKAIPGSDPSLIYSAGLYVDRMSINIELPTRDSLCKLASDKDYEGILKHIAFIGEKALNHRQERRKSKKAPTFVPAGQSTQLIIGATKESDYQILNLSDRLYKGFQMKRVYYSAYHPVNEDPQLPMISKPPLKREHRLYQADWLLRYYGFSVQELFEDYQHNLDEDLDPKVAWALRNPQFFPVDVNKADYETLLRVPGIGVRSAKRIITARRFSSLSTEDLKRIGVVLKRARYFILCRDRDHNSKVKTVDLTKRMLLHEKIDDPIGSEMRLF